MWQALRWHCCQCACQISKWCNDLNYQSRTLETHVLSDIEMGPAFFVPPFAKISACDIYLWLQFLKVVLEHPWHLCTVSRYISDWNTTTWRPSPQMTSHRESRWKHFPRYWPIVRESTAHLWIPLTKASEAQLWCFRWSAPEQTLKQTIETPMIWDVIALIMTSL